MAVGDLYRMACRYSVHSQSNVNVLYMKQTRSIGDNKAQDVADVAAPILAQIYGLWLGGGRGNQFNLDVQLVARLASDIGIAGVPFDGAGASVGIALPPANAVVVRIRTGLQGRTRRGRFFLGGVGDSLNNAGTLNGAGLTKVQQFMTAITTNFMGDDPLVGVTLGVFSRSRYSIISNPFDDYWKQATQLVAPGEIATMRSRKVGVGA